ncbi:MAG: hypothetical protein ACOX4U_02845 [Anaerovoracaceae bacterium]|jgi:hypothetical protein
MFFDSYFNMEFTERKPSDYSYNVIAEQKEPDIQPNGSITATLNFGRGEKDPIKPHQSHSKSNETIYSDTESNTKSVDTVHAEPRDLPTMAFDDTDTSITIDSIENADIQADNKRPSSNFAKARII